MPTIDCQHARRARSARALLAGALAGLLTIAACASAATPAAGVNRGNRYAGAPWASRSPVIAQHGMAATEQPLASLAAVEILKKGGSAVDAAIAASAMLGLTEPVFNGIGGDAFVIVWDPKTHKLYGYNGSGPSPRGRSLAKMRVEVAAAYRKARMRPSSQIPLYGSLPVTVPGLVDTWFALHAKFGRLPISEDLAPAIHYAQTGFPVTEVIARHWRADFDGFYRHQGLINEFANARKLYLIDGHTPAQGEIFRNPDLAHTLQVIARGGREVFYKGAIAHAMADYFKHIGGDLRYSDFADYHGEWVDPRAVDYRGYDVFELPPNSQGFATLEMLNILGGYDLKQMGAGSIDTLMAEIGAKRLAFQDLAKYYADPRFYKVPANGLLSKAYADQRRKLLDLQQANPDLGAGKPAIFNSPGDTTNFVTADDDGMMVSMIESNYDEMGSGLVAPGLGFMFQDRGALYSLRSGDANVYAPGKPPFQTIIPAFVMHDGEPWMAFSVMGGPFQPIGQTQILVNMIDFGMNVQEAGDAARWDHTGSPTPTGLPGHGTGTVILEEGGFASGIPAALRARGYQVKLTLRPPVPGGYGGYEAIRYHAATHTYWGATEMRKDGEVVGY